MEPKLVCGIKQWSAKEQDEEGNKREAFWFECTYHGVKVKNNTRSARAAQLTRHKEEAQR